MSTDNDIDAGAPIVMVGAMPPPVTGKAAVSAKVYEQLRQFAVGEPLVIDLSASSLDRSVKARLVRLPKVLRGIGQMMGVHKLCGWTLYISVSGGLGQVYECAFIWLARLHGMRVFLHHHSFAYLDNPTTITRGLTKIAGPSAVHVALSPGMAERLRRAYGVRRTISVSNSVFLMQGHIPRGKQRQHFRTLGFISNISAEKGVFDFLDLLASMQAKRLPLRAKLAGPFQDANIERHVRTRLATLMGVEYVGPKYGAEKEVFFSTIDALIFPTRYENEAEPLVVHEAMSRSIPVIAYGRGAIPEIIGPECGKIIDPTEPFLPAALAQIMAWQADAPAFEAVSSAAARRFEETYTQNERRWRVLLGDLIGSSTDSGKNKRYARRGLETES